MLTMILACLVCQEDTLFYHFPDGSKDPEVQRTIKALSARIEDSKFSGVKVLPLKRENVWAVGIHSAAPIGQNLSSALHDMATMRASKIEVFLRREMNAQEADTYKPGGSAPAGCVWKSLNGTPTLFEKAPIDLSAGIRYSDGDKVKLHPHIAPGVPYVELSPAASAKMENPDTLKRSVLAIDGAFVNSALEYHFPADTVRGIRVTGDFLQNKVLGICINHPLSLDLKKQD